MHDCTRSLVSPHSTKPARLTHTYADRQAAAAPATAAQARTGSAPGSRTPPPASTTATRPLSGVTPPALKECVGLMGCVSCLLPDLTQSHLTQAPANKWPVLASTLYARLPLKTYPLAAPGPLGPRANSTPAAGAAASRAAAASGARATVTASREAAASGAHSTVLSTAASQAVAAAAAAAASVAHATGEARPG
eukprot:scaffold98281_cov22-Tisochrysis_lutea.AAC.2